MTKLVSKTLDHLTWRNSRLLHELDPREIEAMKGQVGKDMIIFGSGSIVSQLTHHGLIDEYQFVVCPILLGGGQPLLRGVSKRLRLDLLEAKELPLGRHHTSLWPPKPAVKRRGVFVAGAAADERTSN